MDICESLDTTHRRHDRLRDEFARLQKYSLLERQSHFDAKNAKPVIFSETPTRTRLGGGRPGATPRPAGSDPTAGRGCYRRARARERAAASARHGCASTRRCSSTATPTASSRNSAAMMSATWRGVSERGGRRTRGARGGGGAGGSAKRAEPDHAPASPPRTQHTRTTYSPPASSSSSWNWLSFPL